MEIAEITATKAAQNQILREQLKLFRDPFRVANERVIQECDCWQAVTSRFPREGRLSKGLVVVLEHQQPAGIKSPQRRRWWPW